MATGATNRSNTAADSPTTLTLLLINLEPDTSASATSSHRSKSAADSHRRSLQTVNQPSNRPPQPRPRASTAQILPLTHTTTVVCRQRISPRITRDNQSLSRERTDSALAVESRSDSAADSHHHHRVQTANQPWNQSLAVRVWQPKSRVHWQQTSPGIVHLSLSHSSENTPELTLSRKNARVDAFVATGPPQHSTSGRDRIQI